MRVGDDAQYCRHSAINQITAKDQPVKIFTRCRRSAE
jgi:hypothetical protein